MAVWESRLARVIKSRSLLSLSPVLARMMKRVGVYPRYFSRCRMSRTGYEKFHDLYANNVLFIAGLPKSGTTWLEAMLASYPGFHEVLIPDVTKHELAFGGSHDYELPDDIFQRFEKMLVVTKMHVHGSPHNVQLLYEEGIKYVVLYRDLRDVAVSHYFYVRQTPWHPEYDLYRVLSLEEGLMAFAERLLVPFAKWVRSWKQNRDPALSLMFRYEDLLGDPFSVMMRVARHFELDDSEATVGEIVEQHSFSKLSGGRRPGEANEASFFRKGVAGDWENHFTPEVRAMYKRKVGDFLIEFDYETDYSW